jgi:hypothetical protein
MFVLPEWMNLPTGTYVLTASASGDSGRPPATAARVIKVKKCG